MKGRNFEAGHTTAPDHMPDRTKRIACIHGGVHTRPGQRAPQRQVAGWGVVLCGVVAGNAAPVGGLDHAIHPCSRRTPLAHAARELAL